MRHDLSLIPRTIEDVPVAKAANARRDTRYARCLHPMKGIKMEQHQTNGPLAELDFNAKMALLDDPTTDNATLESAITPEDLANVHQHMKDASEAALLWDKRYTRLQPLTGTLSPIFAKRYFTIGEVSDLCGIKAHVLRYWEQEFTQLKPLKLHGDNRYYQQHEVLLVRRIRELLYDQGCTIEGARTQLSNQPSMH